MDKSGIDYLMEIFTTILKERPDIATGEAIQAAETAFTRFTTLLRPEQS